MTKAGGERVASDRGRGQKQEVTDKRTFKNAYCGAPVPGFVFCGMHDSRMVQRVVALLLGDRVVLS